MTARTGLWLSARAAVKEILTLIKSLKVAASPWHSVWQGATHRTITVVAQLNFTVRDEILVAKTRDYGLNVPSNQKSGIVEEPGLR